MEGIDGGFTRDYLMYAYPYFSSHYEEVLGTMSNCLFEITTTGFFGYLHSLASSKNKNHVYVIIKYNINLDIQAF